MPFLSSAKKPPVLVIAAVLVLVLTAPALAQYPPTRQAPRTSALDILTGTHASAARQAALDGDLTAGATLALEGAVDPDAYLVGPGDVFTVAVNAGTSTQAVPVTVSADGLLLLPEGGSVQAAGRSLAAVRADAVETLRTRFENQRIQVALLQPRRFLVHVAGAVPRPGRHAATPVARVDDVLRIAFLVPDTTAIRTEDTERLPSLRNVLIQHRDGSRDSIDLLRYYATGETDHNPYLRDGDVVTVQTYRPEQDALFIDGDIAAPGVYDFRPGDTVLDVLRLAADPGQLDDLETVRLTRVRPDGGIDVQRLRVPDLLGGNMAPVPLQPRDHVHVPLPTVRRGVVHLDGALAYPGSFPIVEGETTLQQVIEHAGGFRDDALLRGAYLERDLVDREDEDALDARTQSLIINSEDQRENALIERYYPETRLASLDFFSRAFLLRELDRQNRVSLRLADLLATGADVPLFDGDRLVVPRDRASVAVIGQVTQAGYVEARPGWTAKDYVAAAGGRGPEATTTFVIEAGTGRFLPANAPVRSGDIVFVDRESSAETPRLQQLQLQQEQLRLQRRAEWRNLAISVVTASATILTMVLTLRRN